MKSIRFILILFSLLSLSGCSGWNSYMNSVSNKYNQSSDDVNAKSSVANKEKCNQWCHNGWCSTHCEQVTS